MLHGASTPPITMPVTNARSVSWGSWELSRPGPIAASAFDCNRTLPIIDPPSCENPAGRTTAHHRTHAGPERRCDGSAVSAVIPWISAPASGITDAHPAVPQRDGAFHVPAVHTVEPGRVRPTEQPPYRIEGHPAAPMGSVSTPPEGRNTERRPPPPRVQVRRFDGGRRRRKAGSGAVPGLAAQHACEDRRPQSAHRASMRHPYQISAPPGQGPQHASGARRRPSH